MRTAKEAFTRGNGDYGYGRGEDLSGPRIDEMREHEFPQLKDIVYLDHAGATLYGKSQLQQCFEELQGGVLGNPHSHSLPHAASSDGSTASRVAAVRRRVLRFFNASEEDYAVVFTSGATSALKIVGECFPWSDKSTFAHSMDSHTSVLGVRSYASHNGASVKCVPLDQIQRLQLEAAAAPPPTDDDVEARSIASHHHLFAFPAECNFSGTRHDLSLVSHIQQQGYNAADDGKWLVLLDAAKFVATHPLDLRNHRPDFVALSFYKMFGYPTGIGALLVRRQRALPLLQKRYYGGGTVSNILASSDIVRLRDASSEARLEDGTVAFLSILSLRHGFDQLEKLTMRAIDKHTGALGALLRSELQSLRHWNGVKACVLYGDTSASSITSFNFIRADGSFVGYAEVGKLAAIHNIHLRTGCFCNPGACQWHLGLKESDLMQSMAAGHVCGDDVDLVNGLPTGAVRVSVGYMSAYEDIAAFTTFVSKYFVSCVAPPESPVKTHDAVKDAGVVLRKLVLFPIKSCAGMSVKAWPVGSRGLLYDREWAILDASTRKALTLKDAPEMCFLDPVVDLQRQQLTIHCRKSNDSFSLPLYATLQGNKDEDAQDMRVCTSACKGRDVGDGASEWLSDKLQRACRLVRVAADNARSASSSKSPSDDSANASSSVKIGFANQAQFLLISRASVANVNASLAAAGADMQIHEDAFRANLVVDTHEAFAEDAWKWLRVGDVSFDVTGPCSRCSMINIDPQTGAFHRAPLQVLSRYRRERSQIFFGQFLTSSSGVSSAASPSSSPSMASRGAARVAWLRCGTSVDVEVVDGSL